MKIAVFGHKCMGTRSGGVETVVEQLCVRMAELGHQITCYDRGGGATRCWHGVRICPVWTVQKKGLAAVTSSFFAAVCAAVSDAQVVHIHSEGPAFWCWLPKLFGKRVIVTVHGLDWQREKWRGSVASAYIRMGERAAVRFADRLIVLSRNMQNYFQRTYHRDTVWIPNGISPPVIREAKEIRERFDLEADGYLLFLGRLVPEKGIHYLIQAFRMVKTGKKLVIAGETSDSQDYGRHLKDLAAGDGRILFAGFVQGNLREELYSNAWVYILPSDLEGMPLSLLEAMGCGNCCLISDIPECVETAGAYALQFARGNITDLQAKLQLLCDSPDVVQTYREQAKEHARKHCDWETVTEKTLELYP